MTVSSRFRIGVVALGVALVRGLQLRPKPVYWFARAARAN